MNEINPINPNELSDGEEVVEIIDIDDEPYEIIDTLEYDGITYYALTPFNESGEFGENEEFSVLQEVEENGEFFLATIDDEETDAKIGKMFEEKFNSTEIK